MESSPPRHRLRRRRSPSPSSGSPFSNNIFSRPYSPSTRASDIARLLDPAYASPNSLNAVTRSTVPQVYVDHHGHLHDPDFRHFPIIHTHIHTQRPRWEPTYQTPDDDSDDDEFDDEPKRSSFDTQRHRPSSSTTTYPTTTTTTTTTSHSYRLYEEPSSFGSRYLAEDDDDDDLHAPLKEKECRFSPRSRSSRHKRGSANHNEKSDQTHEMDEEDPQSAAEDWTPTCTQSLRRQWQAFTLGFRFSLFRTKRRIKRRMTR
ncbi:hypothetical protein V8B97DRAFT_1354115 [Scleroderma yunnanense]